MFQIIKYKIKNIKNVLGESKVGVKEIVWLMITNAMILIQF